MSDILHFETLSSTQTYLKEHYKQLDDKTVVVADQQTAGRGRFDRRWISQPGGLYFSILLKPTQSDFLANLTQLMALSICQAAEKHGIAPNLKWPNDVQVNGKKLCGILSEAVAQDGHIACIMLGVGINIAQADLSHVGQPAVSLYELGARVDKELFLQEVLNLFSQRYEAVLAQGFQVLRTAYIERFPFLGKQIAIKNGNAALSGIARDLSPRGTLLVQTNSGLQEILIGDLQV